MKNKFIKAIFVSFLCLIIFAGCAVVPSLTPEITPTPEATPIPTPTPTPAPTPAPWIATFNKYKTKMMINAYFPSWFYYLTADQNVIIDRLVLYGNTFDREAYNRETDGLSWDTDGKKLNEIGAKYNKLAAIEFLKKYGLEDQILDKKYSSTYYVTIENIITTVETAEKIISDHDVINMAMIPLDKNGNEIPSYVYNGTDGKYPLPYPYIYDEDWNLIHPKGPVYDKKGNMVYDENGKRVVFGN